MNVYQNIAFGLGMKKAPSDQIEHTVHDALDQVQLAGFEKRRPSQLSGGQKQRVALARALVMRPEVLLLDEPLGALDMKLRKEMQVELKNLQEMLKLTFIFVTHDQEEALLMSDRVAVMNRGRIEQVGKSCSEIFEHPRTQFVANFIGAVNIFEASLSSENGIARLKLPGGPSFEIDARGRTGGNIQFIVRPEKMLLTAESSPDRVCLPVKVTDEIFQGINTSWVVEYSGKNFIVVEQNTNMVEEKARFSRGDAATLSWNPKNTVLLDD